MPTMIYSEAAGGKRELRQLIKLRHRRAAAHCRAGGKRALRLLIFRFWVDFEEIYLYFVPPRGPEPRILPSAVTAGHEAAFHIGAPRGVRGPDGAWFLPVCEVLDKKTMDNLIQESTF